MWESWLKELDILNLFYDKFKSEKMAKFETLIVPRGLMSPQIETPPFTIIDYDFTRLIGLEMTDIQCGPFRYDGHKMRILGKVSTTIQCVEHGKITEDFHIEAKVASDLYALLDSHCVIGTDMMKSISALNEEQGTSDDGHDTSQDIENAAAQTCAAAQTVLKARLVEDSSSSPLGNRVLPSTPGEITLSLFDDMDQRFNTSTSGARRTSSVNIQPARITNSSAIGPLDGMISPGPANRMRTSTPIPMDQMPSQMTRSADSLEQMMSSSLRGQKTSTSARGIRMTGSPSIIPIPNKVDQMKKIKIRKCQVNLTRVQACGTCHISPGHECDLFWNPDVSVHCAKCCAIVQEDKEK